MVTCRQRFITNILTLSFLWQKLLWKVAIYLLKIIIITDKVNINVSKINHLKTLLGFSFSMILIKTSSFEYFEKTWIEGGRKYEEFYIVYVLVLSAFCRKSLVVLENIFQSNNHINFLKTISGVKLLELAKAKWRGKGFGFNWSLVLTHNMG